MKNIKNVVENRLCIGCGVCTQVCDNIIMKDIESLGLRPINNNCISCGKCLTVCPGIEMSHKKKNWPAGIIKELEKDWGPILEVWEGYSNNDEIRINGSSGGGATGLAYHCISEEKMSGVLHIGSDNDKPLKNKSMYSTNFKAIVENTGSRYSPAMICDKLHILKHQSVCIGKPCDIQAVEKYRRINVDNKIGLTIGIFCAGTPSTKGTKEYIRQKKVDEKQIDSLKYRGKGWPGFFEALSKNKTLIRETYKDSWGFIQKYRPYRCYLCPDSTSEFADISVGDPWYRTIKDDEKGFSLFLIRTDRGREIFNNAIKKGYITATKKEPNILPQSQTLNLKRSALFGRILTSKMLGIKMPKYGEGFPLFSNWMSLSIKLKIKSILSTVKRIVTRNYWRLQTTWKN